MEICQVQLMFKHSWYGVQEVRCNIRHVCCHTIMYNTIGLFCTLIDSLRQSLFKRFFLMLTELVHLKVDIVGPTSSLIMNMANPTFIITRYKMT